jgi:Immunity protein family (Imm11)
MTMYYALSPTADKDGDMMALIWKPDTRGRTWITGAKYNSDAATPPHKRPPPEPVQLTIDKSRQKAPFPTFLRMPVPLMHNKLLEVVRGAGVDNIDAYRAELFYPDGKLASSDYHAFNLLGLVKAADLGKSKFDPEQPNRMVAMGFDSLVIDPNAAQALLMFRLAENASTIVIHERVKAAIEAAGIELVAMHRTEEIAVL